MNELNNFEIKEISSADFSEKLLEIPQSPDKLYYVGKIPDLKQYKILTVVGSRIPTVYAREALEFIMKGLSGAPIVVVSGLAFGIDALAHSLALKHGLKTIAIPGSGLHPSVLYPKSHFNLAKQIVENGGLLLSEFEAKQAAAKWTFPQRNRIMAALADLVFMVEAKEKSGTLITARLALEYNKDLATLPCDIFKDACKGNLQFLKMGAYPISSAEDILDLLDVKTETSSKDLDFDLPKDEEAIVKAARQSQDKEEIIKLSGLSITEFQIAFSKLELKGLIKEELGKVFLLF